MTTEPTSVRQIFPVPQHSVDPVDAYGRLPRAGQRRPAVRVNMIVTADGAATVKNTTAGLGGTADHAMFATLRSLADVILVGAGTMRTERYGPVSLDSEARGRREGLGLPPVPAIAVLTRSCKLVWSAPFFFGAGQRPLVVTTSRTDASDRKRAAAVATSSSLVT